MRAGNTSLVKMQLYKRTNHSLGTNSMVATLCTLERKLLLPTKPDVIIHAMNECFLFVGRYIFHAFLWPLDVVDVEPVSVFLNNKQ